MRIANPFHQFLTVGATVMSLSGAAMAAGDCWLEIYAETGFQGEHTRIEGPTQLPSLRSVAGSDWSNRIDSLVVGPKAYVAAFRKEKFQEQPLPQPYHPDALKLWGEKPFDTGETVSFFPGQNHHHLGELGFHHNINSLKIGCIK